MTAFQSGQRCSAPQIRQLPWSSVTPELIRDWQDLLDRRRLNPTLGPSFVETTARSFGKLDRIHVYCEYRDDSLCTVIPYLRSVERTLGISLRTVQLSSNLMSYHPEIVTDCETIEPLGRFLAALGPWDLFSAASLIADGPTAHAVAQWARTSGGALLEYAGDESPYLAIEADWGAYLATRPKKFRYRIRRSEDQLVPRGTFALRWFRTQQETPELLDAMLAIEARSWKARMGLDITSHPWEVAYYRSLLPTLAADGSMAGAVLYADDKPVAYSLCIERNRWVGQVKTSFDEAYEASSPGSVVIKESIQWAFETGATEFDFLGHTDRHKRAWTDRSRRHVNYFVYSRRPLALALGRLKSLKHRLSPPTQEHPVKQDHQ